MRGPAQLALVALALTACAPGPSAPAPLLPGLSGALPALTEVRVEQGDTALVFERDGEDWRIRDAAWRADRRWLQPLLLGLANAHCDEPRTADPERFARIGVAWPAMADAEATDAAFARPTGRVVMTIEDRESAVIVGYPQARGGTFVRIEGAPNSCLTQAELRLPARVSEWFDPLLWRVPVEGIAALRIEDEGREPIRLVQRDGRFVREGDLLALTPMPDALAAALASPRQIGRRTVDEAAAPARVLHLERNGGNTLSLALRRDGEQTWARVLDAPEGEDAMFATREFQLPADVAEPLWASREMLGASP
jgi:hypothetical protein